MALVQLNLAGPADMADSLLAGMGRLLAPIFRVNGFGNWEASVALLQPCRQRGCGGNPWSGIGW